MIPAKRPNNEEKYNAKRTKYSNQSNQSNLFETVIEILKYNIWEYFIDYGNNDVSNMSEDL